MKNQPGGCPQKLLGQLLAMLAGCTVLLLVSRAQAATVIYRSVGPGKTAALATGAGNALAISGTSADFASALPDNVGVGDVIQYDADNDGTVDALAVICGRNSANSYVVATTAGGAPAAVSGDLDWSIFRAYTSLANAGVGTENSGIYSTLGNFDTWSGGCNMVANDFVWQIACYADAADTTNAGFSQSWNGDATHYLRIYTPVDPSEVGGSQRHAGKWTTTAYRLEVNTGDAISVTCNFLRIEGLQIRNLGVTAMFTMGIVVMPATGTTLDYRAAYNILWGLSSSAYDYHDGMQFNGSLTSGTIRVWNNIIYDYRGTGSFSFGLDILIGANAYIYNNTIQNCQRGFTTQGMTATFINNIAQNCSDGYSYTSQSGSDYNLSDLAGDAPGTNSKNSTTVTFVDKPGRDLHLAVSDTGAKDSGTDLSGDGNLPFDDDIDGEIRTGTWDMGADEQGPIATQSATVTSTPTATPTPTASRSATLPSASSQFFIPKPLIRPARGESLHIQFRLDESARVILRVYDLTGRQVAKLLDRVLSAGNHDAAWDAAGAGSGTYMVWLEAGGMRLRKKVVVVR